MDYFLGLDCGGTKTATVILDSDRRELGRGAGGRCNIASTDDATLRESVYEAVQSAINSARRPNSIRFDSVCAGVAGYTAKGRRPKFVTMLASIAPARCHRLEPDFVTAWWGATGGEPGILVIAGTGAVVYGRSRSGESCRIDGRGWLLGDKGGGFDLGRMALRRTLQRLDAGLEPDRFDRGILDTIHAHDTDDIIEWTYRDFQPARIAGLATTIASLANDGDAMAIRLIASCAEWLRLRVKEVMRRLNLPADAPVYPAGGMWEMGDLLRIPFRDGRPRDSRPLPEAFNLQQAKHDAAYGAALLAMRSDSSG